MDDYRYTYAVARINALSIRLLDRDFASRMMAAELDDTAGILGGTIYAESLAGAANHSQIEKGLLRELRKTYELLEEICPVPELMRLFRVRYDIDNVKAIVKSHITGLPFQDSITELGMYDADALSGAIKDKKYRFIPEHLADAALNALAEYEKLDRLEAIDCACDRSMWLYVMQRARKHRNKIVTALFRKYINLTNIKTFLRVTEFTADPHVLERFLIPAGDYTVDFFVDHMGEELGLFLARLTKTRHEEEMVSHGLQTWPDDKSFWRLEVACDNFILRHFWQMRMQLFSIAPLIYYLLRRTAEVKLIRTIIKCKIVGMARPQIEAHLRYLYV